MGGTLLSDKRSGFISYVYENRWQVLILAIFLAVLLFVAFFFRPLFDGIILGIFFAYVTRPVKDFLDRYTKFSPYIATFCILIPVFFLILYGILEARTQLMWVSSNLDVIYADSLAMLSSLGIPMDPNTRLDGIIQGLTDYLISFLRSISVKETAESLLLFGMNAIVSIFVCFYLLKDGGRIVLSFRDTAPSTIRSQASYFIAEADRILNGIYMGTFYTALFIATMSFIIFYLFNMPYLILCTAFVFIAAMVPILSGMMVFLPLTVYELFARGPLMAGIFLCASVILVYIPPDYIIRPYLINRASNLHPLLIILSFIGGGLAGGLAGFFAAPLATGILVAFYRTYRKFGEKTDESVH
ncbi:AI-2E family transporter [Methanocella sp. CWC-04]|uniref:AI-2E family transporter n=1 Tax=Methanooceanicella nereidis TaxID=2052831 RepID=A0AAP2W7A4_9EURY|nr:AI-2E family transporter [Methanocella sp. CWC-04]MCD1296202.1 AI-2E family transporter [Methanocella sp. CWC-04]